MKKQFRARFRWSIGTEGPDRLTPQAAPRPARGPALDAAARVSTMLDPGLRVTLVVSAIAVFA